MMEARIVTSLQAALEANEVATALDPHEAAYFILNSWEGALTRMKTEKSLEPLAVFDKMIFGFLLRTTGVNGHSRPKTVLTEKSNLGQRETILRNWHLLASEPVDQV